MALRRDGRRPSTQARKVAAIRSFYGFALREELADRDVAALLDAPKAGSYLPDVLSAESVISILDAPPADDPVGIRDRAILELLYACGLRVSELTGLDTDRLDLPGLQVRVIGKGNRERRVPMGEEARERIHRLPCRSARGLDRGSAERRPSSSASAARGWRANRSGGWCDAGRRPQGSRRGSRRTPFGTASPRICSRGERTCGWFRRSLAMLASAPPSSTRT